MNQRSVLTELGSSACAVPIQMKVNLEGIQSAVMLAGRKLYVSSNPQQVSDAIASAGGSPLPLPAASGALEDLMGRVRNWISPQSVWE